MYHDLAEDPSSVAVSHRPYVLTPAAFEAQMGVLDQLGIRGASLRQALDGAASTDERPFSVLTFDDGHASNVFLAAPILRRHGFSATFFVTAGWIGQPPYMAWEQLRALVDSGMEVGTHSLTHRPPSTLAPAELEHEMSESRRILENGLGSPITTGSEPTGFHHPRIGAVARAAGYRALCVSRIGHWRPGDDAFDIPRVPVKQDMPLDIFRRLASGDGAPLRALRARQMARNALKRTLGTDGYLRLRRALLGLRDGTR
jgi:peptidoglycan/xylan/chitin deacetylase (PgdA/CDA1 family)